MELAVILILVLWVAPMVVTYYVAKSRNRSGHYAWWAFALGWLGAIIAMVVVLVQAEKPPPETRTAWKQDHDSGWVVLHNDFPVAAGEKHGEAIRNAKALGYKPRQAWPADAEELEALWDRLPPAAFGYPEDSDAQPWWRMS